ncbi:MAG: NAD(P)-binding protein, partial [Opitutales bacterium]|nr:NAD(P)-binding protein [Opitutales bacterium]
MLKDFLEIPRRRPVYRENRASDFADVEVRAGEGEILGQARRCMNCGVPFCHGYGCPLANNIPEFNAAVCAGRLEYAYKILSLTSPFPEFTSRICPALCEAACCAGLPSEPMAVKQTEFFIIENAFKNGYVKPRAPQSRNGRRVAVVGSGPSGLACADRLNELGYEVCVFEKNSKAGGLLRYGIPNFKLEKSVIDRRILLMQEAGISFEYDVEIGRDVSLEFLKKK